MGSGGSGGLYVVDKNNDIVGSASGANLSAEDILKMREKGQSLVNAEQYSLQQQREQIKLQRDEIKQRRKAERLADREATALEDAERVRRSVQPSTATTRSTIITGSSGVQSPSLGAPTIVGGSAFAPPNSGQSTITGG